MCIHHSDIGSRHRLDRRGFLRTSAAAGVLGALALAGSAPAHAEQSYPLPVESVSIQLYTLRELLDQDFDGVLARLAEIGYRTVEHPGLLHGKTPREFRTALDTHGLHATSGHHQIFPYDEAKWRQAIADAVTLGQRYMVESIPLFAIPSYFAQANLTTAELWHDYARQVNRAAALAADAGLEVGVHNHATEFRPLPDDPGRTGFDILLAETDPATVHFELDVYGPLTVGVDPVSVIARAPARFRQLHIKDMAADGSITDPGTGIIDFTRILREAHDLGVDIREYIIEQDNAGRGALLTAQRGYDLLSKRS
ncbi:MULTISPECIES: sugar phosphate isomerase/epimerase family protein [Nocardia]|uniref:sugar phosphate isomerase/epimerase family protein n=1 Tax=Nocardia TaxID=1817 RepID=UPI000D690BD2|nr:MULTISPECIES: sugar phosphate isomerase/epimerase [Nocardia]